nr:hypothetical protein [Tanacetum cinerariifolium]
SQQSRGPSEGYSYPVCTTCGRIHPGECCRAAGTCFKCGQAGHLQKDCKKNTTASTSGQADKKPGASGRVFAITEGHAANTSDVFSDELPGIPPVREVANAARNYKILHERDDDDTERPDKRSCGNGRDQMNRGHQSNRYVNSGSQQSRGPSEG